MTSETTEKKIYVIIPKNSKNFKNFENHYGIIVIILTWIYLYFALIPTLYDGLKDFFFHSGTNILINLTEKLILSSTTLSPYLGGGGNKGQVEIGTPLFYAYCGIGGILSCGITHTGFFLNFQKIFLLNFVIFLAIVPLDLVKCRIQVYFFKL